MKKIYLLSLVISVIAATITINTMNQTSNPHCTSCALQRREKESIGGIIAATEYFEARQDYAVPIPGFIIISSMRHIQSIDECTREERYDFIEFLHKIRRALREALDVRTVYLIQEEDSAHFHLWLFPRYDWMEQVGKKIKSVKPIMHWAQKHLQTPEDIKKVQEAAEILKETLAQA